MKQSKLGIVVILLLVVSVIPSFVSAAWWNPFSWNIFNWFSKPQQSIVQQKVASPTPTNQAVGATSSYQDIKNAIAVFYSKDKAPNVYVVPTEYGIMHPSNNPNEKSRGSETITFQSSWEKSSKITAIGENHLWYYGDKKYISIDDYSLSKRFSVSTYLNTGLEKTFALADKAVFDAENIKSSQDFVDYILKVSPVTILQTQDNNKAHADHRLLLVKASIFPLNGEQIERVLKFTTNNLSGYVFEPVSPADNIQITVFTKDGNMYNITLHDKSQFSKSDIDTFLSTLTM